MYKSWVLEFLDCWGFINKLINIYINRSECYISSDFMGKFILIKWSYFNVWGFEEGVDKIGEKRIFRFCGCVFYKWYFRIYI